MNIKDLHTSNKPVSSAPLFTGSGKNITIRIGEGEQLKEHISKVLAMLVCIEGLVIYTDETGLKITMKAGDYHLIKPDVRHQVDAEITSHLILLR